MPNTRNRQLYKQLVEKINSSSALFLFNFKGISANEITQLRNDIRQKNGSISVVKNTLLNIALSTSNRKVKADSQSLTDSTAILFTGPDPVEPLKTLVKYAQDHEKAELKIGYYESQTLNANRIKEIAKLPPKLTLQAQAVILLANPLQRLVNVSNVNLQKLAVVIDQIKQTKQN